MFKIDMHLRSFAHRETRFNLQKQNFQRFRQSYEAWVGTRATDQLDTDSSAAWITEDVTAAAAAHAPRSKRLRIVTPPWWSTELRDARKAMRAAARKLQVTGDRQRFNALRNMYTSILRKNKIESWRKFCTLEGQQPWGKLYRWLKNGSRKQMMLGLMTRQDGSRCTTLDDSVELLLNSLIPNDPQQQLQDIPEDTTCDLQSFSDEQLRRFVWSIAPNRAPGIDGITGIMDRVLWPSLSTRF